MKEWLIKYQMVSPGMGRLQTIAKFNRAPPQVELLADRQYASDIVTLDSPNTGALVNTRHSSIERERGDDDAADCVNKTAVAIHFMRTSNSALSTTFLSFYLLKFLSHCFRSLLSLSSSFLSCLLLSQRIGTCSVFMSLGASYPPLK
jgi:hypothetical protein